ncbi:LLM class flavin-dependent oxidoreductase [Halanaeroarchaeum sulfurireducens]|uniref:Luciferase-like protein n=1 Tax=Halanaeroarchaeum sulfurireducens TaxID=1604004 RepID=A0A0F7P8B9_9EURY|nr:LLM class flavin-dependent oxidoreductase [Halanaeroarchaeum sulfurireducens]AKH96982.1 luciferase-like protein [Halanaeroarchaeum sulfurireducens]ALG81383.1 luciferase-like protein [Halanaeroarchaeum sulfurireducens]
MPIDLLLPHETERDVAELGIWAERLGYDGLWLGELWGASSVVRLTEIAARTEEIDIGTAILNVYSRTPAVLAMTAATLDDVSDGRFRLGVGTSTRKAVEDLHGMDWEAPNPVRRAHETIELTAAFLEGTGRVDYDGEVFTVEDFPSLDADVPIYHAALGTANRRVVGRLADGWIPHNVPFPELPSAYKHIRETMADAGRDASIDVAPFVPSAVAPDPEAARDVIRGHVAYYVGSGRGYEAAVAQRFPDGASAVADAWREGDRSRAVDRVSDEMVAALGVAGTPADARQQLRAIADIDCVDRPMVTIPSNADETVVDRTIEALAPSGE